MPEEGIVFAVAREITERKHLEQRLQAIVESSPVAMVITDKGGLIAQVNREAERLFGYERDELVGRPVEILIPERFRARASRPPQQLPRESRGPTRFGTRALGPPQGRHRDPIELGLSPLETEEGIFVISVITDVTESKRQERWFKAVVESFPAGLVMIDRAGIIRLVNKETERLFGYSRHELIGRQVEILIPERSRAGEPPSLDRFARLSRPPQTASRREILGRRKDGTELRLEIELNPIESGERVLVVTPVLDLHQGEAGVDRR